MSSADGIHPVATSPLAKFNEARAIAILIDSGDSDPHFTPRAPLAGMFAKFLLHAADFSKSSYNVAQQDGTSESGVVISAVCCGVWHMSKR